MVYRLHSLGHHVVIGGHYDDGEVGHLGSAGTHGGERLMARGVEESDVTAVVQFHVVGSDMLCDTSGLAGDHICFADIVEKRSLTVVHVSHHGYNRGTGHEVFLLVSGSLDGFGHIGADKVCLESELLGHDVDGLGIESLVDRHHHTEIHTGGNDLVDGHVHKAGKVVGGDELGDFKNLAFSCLALGVLHLTVVHLLAFLLAELHALLH